MQHLQWLNMESHLLPDCGFDALFFAKFTLAIPFACVLAK